MRSISDYLDVRLRDLALPAIADQQLSGGLQVISFADGTRISVGPFASDTEIERAARAAFSKTLEQQPLTDTPVPTADRMPPVDLAKPADTGPKMAPVSRALAPGSFAAGLRAMMDEAMFMRRGESALTVNLNHEANPKHGHVLAAAQVIASEIETIIKREREAA